MKPARSVASVGQVLEVGRYGDRLERGVAVGLAQLAAVDRALQGGLDALAGRLRGLVGHLDDDDGEAGAGVHLGDAGAHEASADDSAAFDGHDPPKKMMFSSDSTVHVTWVRLRCRSGWT